jgi:hypothetical protein
MGRRSRKRPVSDAPAAPRRQRVPSAERDAIARAGMAPLEPGERPLPLKIAAVVSVLFAVTNVVLYAADVEVEGPRPALVGVLAFAGIMLVAAWGIWTQRYWAVLGFQALLAISILFASLALLVASNIAAAALCLISIAAGSWLFWKLIRVLGRMKVPRMGER